ncbi:MAG: SCO family protein [Polyangiaceae bacterium]
MTFSRVAVTLGGLAAATGLAFLARAMRPQPPMPVYGHLPGIALVDAQKHPFTSDAMRGHATVVDFIFTHCTSSCPRLTARMAEIQGRLAKEGSGTKLLSISVDPENDTPDVLAKYAEGTHADPARWSFVTGPADDVEKVVVGGFKIAATREAKGAGESEVVHGDWFVLVDAKGDIRGYYPTSTDEEVAALWRDVRRIERGGS